MGRKKVWPPKVIRHKASGLDRVRVDNRDIYLGPTGSAEAARAYADLLERWEKEGRGAAPTKPAASAVSVPEVVCRFDDYARRRYAGNPAEWRAFRNVGAILAGRWATLPASGFGLAHLRAVREEMARKGWCRTTVNQGVGRVRTAWRWAEEEGLVPGGSWASLRALRPLARGDGRAPESAGRRACATRDFMLTAKECPPMVRAIILACWLTGARPGEMRRMRPCELDRSKPDVWLFRPEKHKGAWREQPRVISVGPRAQKVLRDWLAGKSPDDWVFPGNRGTPLLPSSLARIIKAAREKAGVGQRVTAYVGRHCAKRRITRAMGLDAARAALGQATMTTTDLYDAGPDEELARRAAKRLG